MVDDQITVLTANRLLNLQRHLRCLTSVVAFRQAHLRLNDVCRGYKGAAYKATQGKSNSPDHVTIGTIVDKLKSWQYSSLDSDDLLADLDTMIAEVTTYSADSDPDVFWACLLARRSDYTAIMNYLKPIQDVIASEHVSTGSLRTRLRNHIEAHLLPLSIDMRRASWFSESPEGSVEDVVTAKKKYDMEMRTYAYHNFWARVKSAGWKELEEDLPNKSVENKIGDSGPSPNSGRQTRGQIAAWGNQLEEADVHPSKKRTAESRDTKRPPKAAKRTRKLDPEDVEALCIELKRSRYGSYQDGEIQEVKSRLVVCYRSKDEARNRFFLKVRNEDGSIGEDPPHRSVIGLVRQLQAEAIVKIGQGRVGMTPPRKVSASGQAAALLNTTPLLVTPPSAKAAAATAVPCVSMPATRVRATPTESPASVQTVILLDGPAAATALPTAPGPAVNGPTAPTPAGPTGAGMPTAATSGVVQNFVTKEQVQDAKKILQKYEEEEAKRLENRQKLEVAQKQKAAIQQKLCEAEAAVATLQAEKTNLGSI